MKNSFFTLAHIFSVSIVLSVWALFGACSRLEPGTEGFSPSGRRDALSFFASLAPGDALSGDEGTYSLSFSSQDGRNVAAGAFLRPMSGGAMPGGVRTKAAPVTAMYDTLAFCVPSKGGTAVAVRNDPELYSNTRYRYVDLSQGGEDIVCWSPADAPGVSFDASALTLTYDTPAEVFRQRDLVVAIAEGVGPDDTQPVPVVFSHALAAVQVKVQAVFPATTDGGATFPECEVRSVTLRNVYGKGTGSFVRQGGTASWQWTVDTDSVRDIELRPDGDAVGVSAGSQTIAEGDYTAMLVPQTFPAGARLEVALAYHGRVFTYSASIASVTVRQGTVLEVSPDGRSMYLFEGTATGPFSVWVYLPAEQELITVTPEADGRFSVLLPLMMTAANQIATPLLSRWTNNPTMSTEPNLAITSVTRTPDYFYLLSSFDDMFKSCRSLESISGLKMSEGVSTNQMCSDCTSLTSFDFPDRLTRVGRYCFYGDASLVIPDLSLPGLTELGQASFAKTKVRKVSDLGTITEIGGNDHWLGAFSDCTELTEVTLPESLVTVWNYGFARCTALETIHVNDRLEKLCFNAFYGCTSLTGFDFPESISIIGDCAFLNCSSLVVEDLSLPNLSGVLGRKSFGYTKVRKVSDLGSITAVGGGGNVDGAFQYCTELTDVVLPETTTALQNGSFCNCTSLVSINIPDACTYIGKNAFSNCTTLPTVPLHDGITFIGDMAFSGSTSLVIEDLSLPNLSTLGYQAFKGTCVRTVTDLGSITELVNQSIFENCKQLISVILPDGLRSIGSASFLGCTSLRSVDIPSSCTTIGQNAFSNCISLIELDLHDGITSIGALAFNGCSSFAVEDLALPNLTYLGQSSFRGTKVKTVSDLGHITELVNQSTFENCTALTSVTLPEGLTSIGIASFLGCTALKTVYTPSSLTTVSRMAFANCSSMDDFYFYAVTPPAITGGAFNNCPATFHVPAAGLTDYEAVLPAANTVVSLEP